MIMESEEDLSNQEPEQLDTETVTDMAPPEGSVALEQTEPGGVKSNEKPQLSNNDGKPGYDDSQTGEDDGEVDDTEVGEAEDGEILEDGEIASDQDCENNDGEIAEEEGEVEEDDSAGAEKQHSQNERKHTHSKREKHSKHHRNSDRDKDRGKDGKNRKKRHREHVDYENKSGDDYDSELISDSKRREKTDRKKEHSSQDDKRRRGSKETRHQSGRDRDSREKDRDKGRDRGHGRHERDKDRGDRNDKDRRDLDKHSRERDRDRSKNYEIFDSPPGMYDSPSASDEEYYNEEFMEGDMLMPKKGKKQQRKRDFHKRKHQRDRDHDDEGDEDQPVKKKPLLQTPMEERPICKFFKEGKCQKGPECPFNHDYQPSKRLELCKYYVQSYCRRDGCVFMHEEFPCKYYHTGSTCYQGDNCKFSHDPLTAEMDIALQNCLRDKDLYFDPEEDWGEKKRKKKGLLGDQPAMSQELICQKLEKMKSIPSIFDIQTHAPGESPNRPPKTSMGPPTSMAGNMGMSMSPNMRFNGPPNRPPPFLGPAQMDGPPPMMGPPMSGPGGLMGPGPPPGMVGPGMQGPPMGPPPPMNQAAAIVGAILRAAPMLQQYRGPNAQVPTSMGNMMGPGMNMDGQNMMGQNSGMPNSMGMMGPMMGMMNQGQEGMMEADMQVNMDQDDGQDLTGDDQQQGQDNLQGRAANTGSKDPRMSTNDPRLNRESSQTPGKSDENSSNQGDRTPTQDWETGEDSEIDVEIPTHLPPKQREMFLRIAHHTKKMKLEQQQQKQQQEAGKSDENQDNKDDDDDNNKMKIDDDKWYSSDEDDDKPAPPHDDPAPPALPPNAPPTSDPPLPQGSSFNVMQMINAIKSNPAPTNTASKRLDPRMQPRPPANIHSREGDCPWRLLRVMYVKNRIPTNFDMQDDKYKFDPRVQKILKMQELESGKVIDHTKIVLPQTKEPYVNPNNPKLPDLLDPNVFKAKESSINRHELPPFVEPAPGSKQDSEIKPPRPVDPRMKPADPRVQKASTPQRPLDPRLSRQDSNSSTSNLSGLPPYDPRLARQNSQTSQSRGSTPPLDPRMINRQSSSDPRLTRTDSNNQLPSLDLLKPPDPQVSKLIDEEIGQLSNLQRQSSQPGTAAEKETSSESQSPKPKLDYRNDPRFKRKHISESTLSPDTVGKRYSGQRKSSTEYSSPLGGEVGNKQEESGYNSYNRPRPPKPAVTQAPPTVQPETTVSTAADVSTHDILDSLQIMPPPGMAEQQGPDKNLKDIFKTIDPTASPFC
ncbi:ZC3H8-like protein [Mya arenaria]|uniref:ZC3H8-like protein n=1 Tax=Mya arenaria TaxID=6604 RepID=A0ABY7DZ34_MYAAR|nr:zinc finger CCCH domain-containing protein 4-like [Mya arenaria]XP_052797784.1 zinc finger CCCH domain-containing protein 4-like [Mya arenaria]XP_052797785.1 zinc finger CCCH domain-containing protein 4-like [Mya arenaria]XP_052797786.1 zinc finger CCCH domain-containing protein 4-like [Mya arenaria]WAR03005.1 ZC3H8-like protein [Mya arenaria]